MFIFQRIGHDNSGSGPGWHLDNVRIEGPKGEVYTFPCNKWFDKKEEDGQIERELYPDNNGKKSKNNFLEFVSI